MPHQERGGRGEHGIEGLCPPTGLLTALSGLLGFGAAIWVFAKHPKVLGRVLLAGMVLALIFYRHGTVLSGNPLIGLIALLVGACCAGEHNPPNNRTARPHKH